MLSVIIPVYNTVNELRRCLDSVCKQTYRDMEIILIDDGSSDGSENIIDEYATNDNRIIAVHQINHGESYSRNVGLSLASGEMVTFVDCDDWIELNMYEVMIECMVKNKLDMVAAGWIKEMPDDSVVMTNSLSVETETFGRDQLLEYIYRRDDYQGFAYMWNKIYKKSLLFTGNGERLWFDENLSLGGDVLFLGTIVLNAKRIRYLDVPMYHYNQRESSTVHRVTSSLMMQWVEAYLRLIELFDSENIPKSIVDYVKRFAGYHASRGIQTATEEDNKDAQLFFFEIMKKYKDEYLMLNSEHPERIEHYCELLR